MPRVGAGWVYVQLAAGMVLFDSATPVSKLLTQAMPVFIGLIWYGAGTLAAGTWLWYSGLARTQGSIAAGFMGLMPVSALALSYVLLDEPFAWAHLAGFGTVFTGVLLMSWEHAHATDAHGT